MTKAELIKALQDDPRPGESDVEVEVFYGLYDFVYPDVQSIGGNATDGYVCLVAR